MNPIGPSDLQQWLADNTSIVPEVAFLSGFVVAPGPFSKGCWFQFMGGDSSPTVNLTPVTGSQPFLYNIGSTTKTFAGTMLAHLPPLGDAGWGTVGDYLAFMSLPLDVNAIELEDLALYSSGFAADNKTSWLELVGVSTIKDIASLTEFANCMNYTVANTSNPIHLPQYNPGEYYTYSNIAYALLGLCVARMSDADDTRPGEKWNRSLQELIKHCGLTMPNTKVWDCLEKKVRTTIHGYGKNSKKLEGDEVKPTSAVFCAAGSVTSTLADMSQWLLFNMGYAESDSRHLAIVSQTVTANNPAPGSDGSPVTWTGLGWHMDPFRYNSKDDPERYLGGMIFKDGGVAGFTAWMSFAGWAAPTGPRDPSSTGVLLLLNSNEGMQSEDGASNIGRSLMDYLMRDPSANAATESERSSDAG